MGVTMFEGLMTTGEVAHLYGVSSETVRYWARVGYIEFVNTGLGRLFVRESVERFRVEREAKRVARATRTQ